MRRFILVMMIVGLLLTGCAAPADAPADAPPIVEIEQATGEQPTATEPPAAAEDEPVEPAQQTENEPLPEPPGEAEQEPEQEPEAGPADGYGVDFDSAWGDLMAANGGQLVWGTLTAEQQALVHYPRFQAEQVFWAAGGDSYHAVSWCYTLGRSDELLSGSLDAARAAGKTDACSKCVGD